ncbi:MAG: tetratricopeptide repeat protein [Hyphomicrobiales bacterium]|nr:tetratricopeptide repeat protein [Hyphomicrobiales bacterium]
MTSKIQRTPGSEASAQPPAATAYAAGIEALLRQYVQRMQETGAAPQVMEMQDRVSELAKTLAGAESEEEPTYRRNQSPAAKMAQSAGWGGSLAAEDTHAQYQAYFDPATEFARHSTGYAPESPRPRNPEPPNPDRHEDERHDMARGWLEKRFSELRQLIEASTAGDEIRSRNAAIEQRVEAILDRLNTLQARSADGISAEAVDRQLRQVADHLEKQQNYNKAHGAALHHIGARLEKLDNTARLGVVASENAGARAEAAVVDAARKSSRQTFEMTARHLTEAFKQTAPAARFTAIETEVRALNQQSRETGQRTARAVEDVHFTLRQFLEHVTPPAPAAPRRAGLTVPVGEIPAHTQPTPNVASSAGQPRTSAKQAPASIEPKPDVYHPSFPEGKDDEYERESSRRVRTGLVIGVLIMLAAGIVLLCINLIGSKPALSRAGSGMILIQTAAPTPVAKRAAWAPKVEISSQAGSAKTVIKFESDTVHPAAQYRMGASYERGRRDLTTAAIWYERAALNGHALAMHNLGVLRAKRGANAANYNEAAQWFEKAALRGVVDSQYNLAVLLERGLGGPSDLTQAYRWYAIAAKSGDVESSVKIELLRAKLSHKDLQNADKFVQSWKPHA